LVLFLLIKALRQTSHATAAMEERLMRIKVREYLRQERTRQSKEVAHFRDTCLK
jgi:hypothetical protein